MLRAGLSSLIALLNYYFESDMFTITAKQRRLRSVINVVIISLDEHVVPV